MYESSLASHHLSCISFSMWGVGGAGSYLLCFFSIMLYLHNASLY